MVFSSDPRKRLCTRPNLIRVMTEDAGFTLIEITIVLALIGVLLFFAIPRFQDVLLDDPVKAPTRFLMVKIPELRTKALRNQKTYSLHIDLSGNRLWTTDATSDAEAIEQAKTNAYQLSDRIRLAGVVFANGKKQTVDVVEIQFYSQGWAERAIIHLETDNRERYSFLIKPFLTLPDRLEGYYDFEDVL